jgi:hypothetical protein
MAFALQEFYVGGATGTPRTEVMKIRKDDRDLGVNVVGDSDPEVLIYDDNLAKIAVAAGIVILGAKLLGN